MDVYFQARRFGIEKQDFGGECCIGYSTTKLQGPDWNINASSFKKYRMSQEDDLSDRRERYHRGWK